MKSLVKIYANAFAYILREPKYWKSHLKNSKLNLDNLSFEATITFETFPMKPKYNVPLNLQYWRNIIIKKK